MEIILKRIKRYTFDDVKNKVLDEFKNTQKIILDDNVLEANSDNVIISGKTIKLNYDVDEYVRIVNSDDLTYVKLAKIGMLLHKESKDINGTIIPKNIFYEPEVWTYISFKVFADVVKKLRLDDDDKITTDKISRFYFNINKRSRTGLLFVWSMIDVLDSEDDYKMSEVAFHFIDPIKAVYERAMAKNPIILKAFVQAIINNDSDPRIKNSKYRQKVPNNISCFARINILDAYEYNELVDTITQEMKKVLAIA